ncbi:MAG: C69 family dipeptidase [Collinsella sp.]
MLPYAVCPRRRAHSGRPARALRYYENNGIAFSDVDEIRWLETIGGHHWIAKRVPDDAYVTMPNQLGIDSFDLTTPRRPGRPHVLRRPALWMAEWHLDLTLGVEGDGPAVVLTARPLARTVTATTLQHAAPGTMQRCLNPAMCGRSRRRLHARERRASEPRA